MQGRGHALGRGFAITYFISAIIFSEVAIFIAAYIFFIAAPLLAGDRRRELPALAPSVQGLSAS
jgi:hypothetical protein